MSGTWSIGSWLHHPQDYVPGENGGGAIRFEKPSVIHLGPLPPPQKTFRGSFGHFLAFRSLSAKHHISYLVFTANAIDLKQESRFKVSSGGAVAASVGLSHVITILFHRNHYQVHA